MRFSVVTGWPLQQWYNFGRDIKQSILSRVSQNFALSRSLNLQMKTKGVTNQLLFVENNKKLWIGRPVNFFETSPTFVTDTEY